MKNKFNKIFLDFGSPDFLDLNNFNILANTETSISDFAFKVLVVGESHVLYSKEFDYYELLINVLPKRHKAQNLNQFVLGSGINTKAEFAFNKKAKINLEILDLDENINLSLLEEVLSFKFSVEDLSTYAYTRIFKSPTGFLTLHEYPEFNKQVISETKFLNLN